jgi:hypothetical protein
MFLIVIDLAPLYVCKDPLSEFNERTAEACCAAC